jgi:CheY-like chemotaxis protein
MSTSSALSTSMWRDGTQVDGRSGLETRAPMAHPIALIVDDDADFRDALAEVLRSEGCHVVEAANGEEAIAVLDSLTPEVILLDLIMPVLNGWSLFAEIEGRPELKGVPVVFMSGVPQMAPGGGSLVLKKPFDLPTILTLLDGVRCGPASSEFRLKSAGRTMSAYRSGDSRGRN